MYTEINTRAMDGILKEKTVMIVCNRSAISCGLHDSRTQIKTKALQISNIIKTPPPYRFFLDRHFSPFIVSKTK